MKPKYSIVTITHNALEHTIRCLESLYKYTKNFELIVVDNNSTDGTVGYLKEMEYRQENMKVIFNQENRCFAAANNQGIKIAKGDYIVFLNNDTILNPDWLKRMTIAIENYPDKDVAMVGPVSNNSAGRQVVGLQDSEEWYRKYKGNWVLAGRLFGWCIMAKHNMLDEIGLFDERFINGFEDNDLCLRAQLAGYKLIIAVDTYIYHAGQSTFRTRADWIRDYMKDIHRNQKKFYDKYYTGSRKKLVAVYRIANCEKYIRQSLIRTSKFADAIIVHLCRSKDRTEQIVREFPKVIKIQKYDGPFQEDYERNWLLQEALKLHEKGEADWCISIDGDEVYEDKFVERCQKMMNPRNPEIFAYWCQWRTIWKTKDKEEFFRADSTFGRFSNYRFYRLIKGQKIISDHPEGHHCGSNPIIPLENLAWCNIRVKHLGYDTPEQRQKKYEFYRDNDHFPDSKAIGHKDYTHLIDEDVDLKGYHADNGISLVMIVKNEVDKIKKCLEEIAPVIDEYIIVDTGSTDNTKEEVLEFAKYASVPVKLIDFKWCNNFSLARNFAKSFATQRWILHLDADESFRPRDLQVIFRMSEEDADIFLFHVINYLEETKANEPPVYASTESIRLFRNIPDLYYTGIVHETLDDAISVKRRRGTIKVMRSPVILHHRGYLRKKDKLADKFLDYVSLNKKQIKITDGKDPRSYFNLALHYLNEKDGEHKALENFQKSLSLNPNFWHANAQMAALNIKSVKYFLNRTLESMPEDHPYIKQVKEILEFLEKNSFGHQKIEVH